MSIENYWKKQDMLDFCRKIEMPLEATYQVTALLKAYRFDDKVKEEFELLLSYDTAPKAVEQLNQIFDKEGMHDYLWLTISLCAAMHTRERYKAMGIDDKIFYDTMACFSRFVREHRESYRTYGFDRQFWTYRQINQTIYRLGELEFEILDFQGDEVQLNGKTVVKKGDTVLSVHIPSDAQLDMESCHSSYRQANEFMKKHYPKIKYNVFYCNTWMLSPNLKDVLPENSKILQFQSDYTLCRLEEDNDAYCLWVYKKSSLELDDYPENTSLQRNLKKYIRNGGRVGEAECIIPKEKFI